MKDAYIVVEHIYKKLRGREILHDMNLSVPSGAIVGLVGANGSGKSMLLRTIAGLIKPSKGKVWVDGKPLGKKHSFPDDLGIVIENVGLWPEYTGMENLALLAKIRGKNWQARDGGGIKARWLITIRFPYLQKVFFGNETALGHSAGDYGASQTVAAG